MLSNVAINRVVQKGSWTVIASGCLGGLPDVPDGVQNFLFFLLAKMTHGTEQRNRVLTTAKDRL